LRQCFLGLEMLAGPEALIPRKETELLARTALEKLTELGAARQPVRVVDVCTGSGNIALVLAHRDATAEVFAADLSEDAVRLARANAVHLGLDARVQFRVGDLLAPFDEPAQLGCVDLLTCNPPYVNSGKVGQMPPEISGHEPRLAFDGGSLGISILMRLSQEAPRFLRPGGWLVFEVGLGQGPALVKRLKASPAFKAVAGVADGEGAIRVVTARC
jgi:release factor glutamine methyltransferase